MKVIWNGPPDHEVFSMQFGAVHPGKSIDIPEDLAKLLLRSGRASLPPKPEKPKLEIKDKKS